MKTILYATDLAEQSVSTLRYAQDLSTSIGANLVVFHSYDVPPIRTSAIRPYEQIEYHTIEEQKEVVK